MFSRYTVEDGGRHIIFTVLQHLFFLKFSRICLLRMMDDMARRLDLQPPVEVFRSSYRTPVGLRVASWLRHPKRIMTQRYPE